MCGVLSVVVSCRQTSPRVHVRVSSSPGAGSTGGPSDIPAVDRRQLLCTTAGLAAASALLPLLVADNAAAAASCDLAGSPSGLQFCDTKVGAWALIDIGPPGMPFLLLSPLQ
jgi:hypothetical protein